MVSDKHLYFRWNKEDDTLRKSPPFHKPHGYRCQRWKGLNTIEIPQCGVVYQSSIKLNKKWKFSVTALFNFTHCCINEELLQRKHLCFYCYCHMFSTSKYIFHYTTLNWCFKMRFFKTCLRLWKYIITILNNFIFPRNRAFCKCYLL